MDSERLVKLQRGLELALNQEWPKLDRTCRSVVRMQTVPITTDAPLSHRIVATVATDGGESKLSIEPIQIQAIRVADSQGIVYFEEFVPLSMRPAEIVKYFFAGEQRLQRLLAYLHLSWEDVAPRDRYGQAQLMAMLRELLEWAATLKLAAEERNLLLLRDGLLRSVLLNERVFDVLRGRLQDLTVRNNHILVGVAKRSAVINYLSIGLGISESFSADMPAYLPISAELEQEAAPAQYRWIGPRSMGQLYVARLDRGESVPLMPVDLAAWQIEQAPEAMHLLHASAKLSFPLRGYPQELIAAHQHARMSHLETEMLESVLMRQMIERNPAVAEKVRQLKLLGRRLIEDLNDGIDDRE